MTADSARQSHTDSCFLCRLSDSHCAEPALDGMLLGAKLHAPDTKKGMIGMQTESHGRVIIECGPRYAKLAQLLNALPAQAQRGLHIRALHLPQGRQIAPPGGEPYLAFTMFQSSVIIIEPDLLLNITDLSQGARCVRLDVLRRIISQPPSTAGLRGVIIHNVFKELLKNESAQPEALLDENIAHSIIEMAEMDAREDEIRNETVRHALQLYEWRVKEKSRLWSDSPRIRAETFLLAPETGLKGRMDILWEDHNQRRLIELKTGGATGELPKKSHRWQVIGYHTLLAARQNGSEQPAMATLLYSDAGGSAQSYGIPAQLSAIISVIDVRNEIALTRATGATPAPPGGQTCERCYMKFQCAKMAPAMDWTPPPIEPPSRYSPSDIHWFQHWRTLQQMEARTAEKESSALWKSSAAERVAAGTAVYISEVIEPPAETARREWIYRLRCANSTELREGDEILVSDGDPVRGEVVSGSVLSFGKDEIVALLRENHPNPVLIDRYNVDIMSQRMMQNLTRWLHTDDRRKDLLRGKIHPVFTENGYFPTPDYVQGLNREQLSAVMQAVSMRDFLLIQGPPGAGKTKVIAALTKVFVSQGYRVALAAYTNQATDTMLARTMDAGVTNMIRLGHAVSVSGETQRLRFPERIKAAGIQTAQEARALLHKAPVVAATVSAWSAEDFEPDITLPMFDVVILDEASQLTTPAALGALRWGRRYILVGDEKQLPPLVVNEEARRLGLGVSLFEDLKEKNPQAVAPLRRQYRMRSEIGAIAGSMFYGGNLIADPENDNIQLAYRPVELPEIIDINKAVVWVDVKAQPGRAGKNNPKEAAAAAQIIGALVHSGVSMESLGVITPFRSQAALIRQNLAALGPAICSVDTVDRFQGGERDIIIISFAGTGAEHPASQYISFLGDPRRLNVAITRAKYKLILIGDKDALRNIPLMEELIRRVNPD